VLSDGGWVGGRHEAKGWVKECRSGWVSPWVMHQSGDQCCSGAIPSPQGEYTVLYLAAMEWGTKHS